MAREDDVNPVFLALSAAAASFSTPNQVDVDIALPPGTDVPERCEIDIVRGEPPVLALSDACAPVASVLHTALAKGSIRWRPGEDQGDRVHVHVIERGGELLLAPTYRADFGAHHVRLSAKAVASGPARCHVTVAPEADGLAIRRFVDCPGELRRPASKLLEKASTEGLVHTEDIDGAIEQHVVLAAHPTLPVGGEPQRLLVVEGRSMPATRGSVRYPLDERENSPAEVMCAFQLDVDAEGEVLDARPIDGVSDDSCTRPFIDAFEEDLAGWTFYAMVRDGTCVSFEYPIRVRFTLRP